MKLSFRSESESYRLETTLVVTYEEAKRYADFHKIFFQDETRDEDFPESITLTKSQRKLFAAQHFKYAFGEFRIDLGDDDSDVLLWQFSHGWGGEVCIMTYDWKDGNKLTSNPKDPFVFNQQKRRLKALLPIYIEESLLRQGLKPLGE